MLRPIVLITALVLVAALAACGGDDSSTTTATVTTSASASSGPSASPASSATDTTAATPIPTATPVPGNWVVSGQVAGSATIGTRSCQATGGEYHAQLDGTLNGTAVGILLTTTKTGTVDFSQASAETTVAVQYGGSGAAIDDYWFAGGGASGLSGSATIESDGSGSLELTVPPSVVAPGGATQPITVSGPWICP